MNILDAMVENSFKKLPDGREAFYPNGIFGIGCILPNDEIKTNIKNFLKTYYIVAIIVVLAAVMLKFYLAAIIAALLLLIWFYAKIRQLTKGLETTTVKLSASETLAKSAKNYAPWVMIVGLIFGLFMIFLGASMFLIENNFAFYLMGSFLLLVGIICVVFYVRLLFLRGKN